MELWTIAGLTFITFSVITAAIILPPVTYSNVMELEPRYILGDYITISGFDSGGIMAQTLQIAYSSFFKGAAIFSSTYYRCGTPIGDLKEFQRLCTTQSNSSQEGFYDVEQVHKDIEEYLVKGIIDNVKYLRNKPLYIYTGLQNTKFSPVQSLRIVQLWEKYIKNPYKIKTHVQDANHVMPTDSSVGGKCRDEAISNHFIANCGFSGAYESLKFLHTGHFIIHRPLRKEFRPILQPLRSFNQSSTLEGILDHQMDEIGFYYVPSGCLMSAYPCLLHVFFHGCGSSRNQSGDNFIINSGFLEVAEMNDIVMLFPQSNPPKLVQDKEGQGCWDHFGLGGNLYATKKGIQVSAVWKLIQGILGKQSPLHQMHFFRHFHYHPHQL